MEPDRHLYNLGRRQIQLPKAALSGQFPDMVQPGLDLEARIDDRSVPRRSSLSSPVDLRNILRPKRYGSNPSQSSQDGGFRKGVRFEDEIMEVGVSSCSYPVSSVDHRVPSAVHPPPPPQPPPPPPVSDDAMSMSVPPGHHPPLVALPPEPPPAPPGPPTQLDMYAPAPDGDLFFNATAYKTYTRFMDNLKEFVDLQGKVIQSRVAVQQKRALLKIERENVALSDIEFMNRLRVCMTEGTVSSDLSLNQLFDAAQAARDKVGPLELEYEGLENGLGAEEFALKEKYNDVEARFANYFKLKPTTTSIPTSGSSISFDPPTDPLAYPEGKEDDEPAAMSLFHGAEVGHTVRVGQMPLNMDIATSPVTNVHSQLQHEVESGHRLSSASEDQMRKRHSTTLAAGEIQDHMGQDDYTAIDFAAGDWSSKDTHSREHQIAETLLGVRGLDTIPEDVAGFDESEHFGSEKDSLLLRGSDTDTQSTLSGYLIQFDSTRDRVNKWLLHKLRVSPWEIFQLQQQVADSSQSIPSWTQLALDEWLNDSAGLGSTYGVGSVASVEELAQQPVQPQPYPTIADPPKRQYFASSPQALDLPTALEDRQAERAIYQQPPVVSNFCRPQSH